MSRWFYLNGAFIEEENAVLPLTQTGIQRAFGIFDLFRTENEQPRFLKDYLNRFERSQKFLNLDGVIEISEVASAVTELQSRNQFKHSTFKLILLGDGPDATETHFQPFFYIVNTEIDPDNLPTKVGVIAHEYVRDFPEIKSLNYFTSYTLHRKRIAAKAGEVVYHRDGLVSEASRSNVFAIKDGTLITPSSNILQGITRMHVIKAAEAIMPVEVGELSVTDFLEADELFLTSTIKEVAPISFVDDKDWNTPGPVTKKIQDTFKEYLKSQKY